LETAGAFLKTAGAQCAPLHRGTHMKNKTQLIKKATAALLPLLLIFVLTGAALPGGLNFTVKETVIADNLDFTYRQRSLANDLSPSYYKDKDGSFVVFSQERAAFSLSEDDPKYDPTRHMSLTRFYPGNNKEGKTVNIHEWVSVQADPRIIEFITPSGIWQNNRGNTVVHYYRLFFDSTDEAFTDLPLADFVFEEYDKDFKLIKSASHSIYDLPGGEPANYMDISGKDDNDYYYIATTNQIDVFNSDFEFLGTIPNIPQNPSKPITGEKYDVNMLLLCNGSDGKAYTYWYDEENIEIYKLDPEKLTADFVFDIDSDNSLWFYPGMGTALFYGVGETLNSIDIQGSVKPVFEWGTNGIAPYFSKNDFSMEDYEDYESGSICFYEKDGNFYNFNIEDKDGNSKTLDDKQLVLYEFIRR
jgi:hypothetical protein